MQLFGSIPTTWDTSIILSATVANHIVTARQKATTGLLQESAGPIKDITLDLSFLPTGNYTATICKDGINADRECDGLCD